MRQGFRLLAAVLVSGFVVLADQLTKKWFETDNASVFSFFFGWIRSVHHENHGAIANLAVPSILIIVVSLLICGLIVFGLNRNARQGRWTGIFSLSILFGGAIGNLVDRMRLGYVRDWILLFNMSAINLADAAIAVGGLWLLWIVYRRQKADVHKSKITADQKPEIMV